MFDLATRLLENQLLNGIFLVILFSSGIIFFIPLVKNVIRYIPPSWGVTASMVRWIIAAVFIYVIGMLAHDIFNLPVGWYPGVSIALVVIGAWPWLRSGGLGRLNVQTERQALKNWAEGHQLKVVIDLSNATLNREVRFSQAHPEYLRWAMYLPTIEGEVLAAASGQLDGREVTLGYMVASTAAMTSSSRIIPAIYLQTELVRGIQGKLRLRPTASPFRGLLPDESLESVQFNRDFDVEVRPKQLAYGILAPDTMEWLMRLDIKPIIFLDGKKCAVIFDGHPNSERLDALLSTTREFWRRLERSGALV